jgi:hypothetical protein
LPVLCNAIAFAPVSRHAEGCAGPCVQPG